MTLAFHNLIIPKRPEYGLLRGHEFVREREEVRGEEVESQAISLWLSRRSCEGTCPLRQTML